MEVIAIAIYSQLPSCSKNVFNLSQSRKPP